MKIKIIDKNSDGDMPFLCSKKGKNHIYLRLFQLLKNIFR